MTSLEDKKASSPINPQPEQTHPDWSRELLADVDRQYGLWSDMLAALTQNLDLAGTAKMAVYTAEEREQLGIMLNNMQQLAACIGGERAERIATLHTKTLLVLSCYDDLTNTVRPYDN